MNKDRDFEDFLTDLLENGSIEGDAAGITRQVISKGKESLSSKQSHVFKKEVLEVFVIKKCSKCGSNIPWSEMKAAHDNGGLCNWCEHMNSKND